MPTVNLKTALLFVFVSCKSTSPDVSDINIAGGASLEDSNPGIGNVVALVDVNSRPFCTAAVIDKTETAAGQSFTILTASHCILAAPKDAALAFINRNLKEEDRSDTRKAWIIPINAKKQGLTHEAFISKWIGGAGSDNDLGLIKISLADSLETEFAPLSPEDIRKNWARAFAAYQPASLYQGTLAKGNHDLRPGNKSHELVAVGFGRTEEPGKSYFAKTTDKISIFQYVDAKFVRHHLVTRSDTFNVFGSADEMKAWHKAAPVSICQGDSGGPLYIKEENKWSIIGIVKGRMQETSKFFYAISEKACSITPLVTYTYVPGYQDWIKSKQDNFSADQAQNTNIPKSLNQFANDSTKKSFMDYCLDDTVGHPSTLLLKYNLIYQDMRVQFSSEPFDLDVNNDKTVKNLYSNCEYAQSVMRNAMIENERLSILGISFPADIGPFLFFENRTFTKLSLKGFTEILTDIQSNTALQSVKNIAFFGNYKDSIDTNEETLPQEQLQVNYLNKFLGLSNIETANFFNLKSDEYLRFQDASKVKTVRILNSKLNFSPEINKNTFPALESYSNN